MLLAIPVAYAGLSLEPLGSARPALPATVARLAIPSEDAGADAPDGTHWSIEDDFLVAPSAAGEHLVHWSAAGKRLAAFRLSARVDDLVYADDAVALRSGGRLYGFDPGSGALVWSSPSTFDLSAVAVVGDHVLATTSAGAHLRLDHGRPHPTDQGVPPPSPGDAVDDGPFGGCVYTADGARILCAGAEVRAYGRDGKLAGSVRSGTGSARGIGVLQDGTVVVAGREVEALDPATLRRRWIAGRDLRGAAVGARTVAVVDPDGLRKITGAGEVGPMLVPVQWYGGMSVRPGDREVQLWDGDQSTHVDLATGVASVAVDDPAVDRKLRWMLGTRRVGTAISVTQMPARGIPSSVVLGALGSAKLVRDPRGLVLRTNQDAVLLEIQPAGATFAPDGSAVVAWSDSGEVLLIGIKTRAVPHPPTPHPGLVPVDLAAASQPTPALPEGALAHMGSGLTGSYDPWRMVLGPDGRIWTLGHDVVAWDPATHTPALVLATDLPATDLAVTDRHLILTTPVDVRTYDLDGTWRSDEPLPPTPPATGPPTEPAAQGKGWLAEVVRTGAEQRLVIRDGDGAAPVDLEAFGVQALVASPSGDRLLVLADHWVGVVDPALRSIVAHADLDLPGKGPHRAAWSADEREIWVVGWRSPVRWLWQTGAPEPLLTVQHYPPDACAYSPNGSLVAANDANALVQVWDAATGAPVQAVAVPSADRGHLDGLRFLTARDLVVTGSTVSVVSSRTGKVYWSREGDPRQVALPVPGRAIAVVDRAVVPVPVPSPPTLPVPPWLTTSAKKPVPVAVAPVVRGVAVSVEGAVARQSGARVEASGGGPRSESLLAGYWGDRLVAGDQTELRVDGEKVRIPIGLGAGPVRPLGVFGDEVWVDRGALERWSLQTGELIAVVGTATGEIRCAAVSPDRTRIVVGDQDGLTVWPAEPPVE